MLTIAEHPKGRCTAGGRKSEAKGCKQPVCCMEGRGTSRVACRAEPIEFVRFDEMVRYIFQQRARQIEEVDGLRWRGAAAISRLQILHRSVTAVAGTESMVREDSA